MRTRAKRERRGSVAVEFAIVAPLLFLLFFAAFEFSRMNMLRHTADMAAYEGARAGISPGTTPADVVNRAEEILASVATSGAMITVTPSTFHENTKDIQVDITIPLNSNAWVSPHFLLNTSFEATCSLRRERKHGRGVL